MRYKLDDGREVDITDKTRPVANKDYPCDWGWHDIKKGDQYVRCTYKVVGSDKLEMKHICLDCFCGVEEPVEPC